MSLSSTAANISVQDSAGAVTNYSSGAVITYTPSSVINVSLQSTSGVQQWNLKLIGLEYANFNPAVFTWRAGQANLIQVPMPDYAVAGNAPINGLAIVSEVSDGVQSIIQSTYFVQSLGGSAVPSSRAVRCIVNLGTGGLAGSGYTNAGGVLTASSNGAWTNSNSDSIAIAVGDRVLAVGAGVNNFDNGVYQVTSLGSASTPWVLTRAPDMFQGVILPAGTTVEVSEGTTYPNTTWKDLLTGAKTVGTTNIAAAFFPSRIIGAKALSSGAITISNLHVASPLGSTAPGPGVSCFAVDFTAANAVKAVLTAGNGNGSIALTGTTSDVIQYGVVNW